ncbi:MAG TPA: hypothetical protein VGR68_04530 [Actinomycetota bacterium]|jgi:hypothetical protein|nr:hypothetical protein [Actinomycetota bacterium]
MSSIVAHSGVMAGSHTMLVFLPLILAGAGFGFIIRAVTDKVDAPPDNGSVRLPTAKERPLYRVHMQIRSATHPPAAESTEPGVVKLPSRRASGGPRN